MEDHRGSWRWQSSSSLTIKPKAGVSDLPTMQHIFKRAQFWPVKNRQLRAFVLQVSGKTRAYLGRCVWRRAVLTAHQPAEHTHYINCLTLPLSLRLPLLLSFVVVALSYLSISLSPSGESRSLERSLFLLHHLFSQTHSGHTRAGGGGVSFIREEYSLAMFLWASPTHTPPSQVDSPLPSLYRRPKESDGRRREEEMNEEGRAIKREHMLTGRDREWGHYVKGMDYSQIRCWAQSRAAAGLPAHTLHTELTTDAQIPQTRKSKWRHCSSYMNTTHTNRHVRLLRNPVASRRLPASSHMTSGVSTLQRSDL